MKIGVLALQGAFREHRITLETLGCTVTEVRLPEHLEGLAGLTRSLGLRHAQLRGADLPDAFARLRRARILERG